MGRTRIITERPPSREMGRASVRTCESHEHSSWRPRFMCAMRVQLSRCLAPRQAKRRMSDPDSSHLCGSRLVGSGAWVQKEVSRLWLQSDCTRLPRARIASLMLREDVERTHGGRPPPVNPRSEAVQPRPRSLCLSENCVASSERRAGYCESQPVAPDRLLEPVDFRRHVPQPLLDVAVVELAGQYQVA